MSSQEAKTTVTPVEPRSKITTTHLTKPALTSHPAATGWASGLLLNPCPGGMPDGDTTPHGHGLCLPSQPALPLSRGPCCLLTVPPDPDDHLSADSGISTPPENEPDFLTPVTFRKYLPILTQISSATSTITNTTLDFPWPCPYN